MSNFVTNSKIDFQVLAKFQVAGPRYTSYPTAIEFSEGAIDYERYLAELAAPSGMDADAPLSLYFHLPFCRSACYFCGCNVIYTANEAKKSRYLDYLLREIALTAAQISPARKAVQMHFGGGTPTFFSAAELERLLDCIHKHFSFTADAEKSCEIDPRFLNAEQMGVLERFGINRISFGVQDFDPAVQKTIHRIQPFELTAAAAQLARSRGVRSINCDLIYGLPLQTPESFARTLQTMMKIAPDRLAVFNYAHVPWVKKNMRKFDEADIPAASSKLAMLQNTAEFLRANGYEMIGMDHFARPDDELFSALKDGSLHRNFQGYTTRGGAQLVGMGLTSIGEGERYYAQNHKDMQPYEAAIDAGRLPLARGVALSDEDVLRKRVIMTLMANFALDIRAIEREFGIDFWRHFAAARAQLEPLADYLSLSDERIDISPTGRLLIRNICMAFDEYMAAKTAAGRTFSKTL